METLQLWHRRSFVFTEKAAAHVPRSLSKQNKTIAKSKKGQEIRGRNVILFTYHQPLLAIFGAKKGILVYTANRLERWALQLLTYNFIVK